MEPRSLRRCASGRRPAKFLPDTVITALHRTRGLIAQAADLLRCSRQTIYDYAARFSEVKEAIDHQRELMLRGRRGIPQIAYLE